MVADKTIFDNLDYKGISFHICVTVEFGVTFLLKIIRKESIMANIKMLVFFGILCVTGTLVGGMVPLGGHPYNGANPKRWLRCAGDALAKSVHGC